MTQPPAGADEPLDDDPEADGPRNVEVPGPYPRPYLAQPPSGPPPEQPPSERKGWFGAAAATYVGLLCLNVAIGFVQFDRAYCGTATGYCVRSAWDTAGQVLVKVLLALPVILIVVAAVMQWRRRDGAPRTRWLGVLIGSVAILLTCSPCYPLLLGNTQ